MSPETLLLDKSVEKAGRAARKTLEATLVDSVSLNEDITPPRIRHRPWEPVRPSDVFSEGEGSEEVGGAVQIMFDAGSATERRTTPLRQSLEALSELRSGAAEVDWLEAAVVLKRDVVRLRDTNYSRHAAVLLALADALTFTEPAEVPSTDDAKPFFSHALGLLSEPYISEASEEEFLGELLLAGWNLAPSEEQALELVD